MAENSIWDNSLPFSRFLNMISKSYYGALVKKLEPFDIEHYYSILITLDESSKGHCSQQTLCDVLKVDKASMVKKIDYLSKRGFAKRSVNPDDRREHRISLTEKARKILPEIRSAVADLNARATDGLSTKEKEQFYAWLQLAYQNISSQPAHDVVMKLRKLKKTNAS